MGSPSKWQDFVDSKCLDYLTNKDTETTWKAQKNPWKTVVELVCFPPDVSSFWAVYQFGCKYVSVPLILINNN